MKVLNSCYFFPLLKPNSDALWDRPGAFNVTGPNATAGIFATYPGKHLTLVNGFFDQARFLSNGCHRIRCDSLNWAFLSLPFFCRLLARRHWSFVSWPSSIPTIIPSHKDWRPSLWALWFWSSACRWVSTRATQSIPPETSDLVFLPHWPAGG